MSHLHPFLTSQYSNSPFSFFTSCFKLSLSFLRAAICSYKKANKQNWNKVSPKNNMAWLRKNTRITNLYATGLHLFLYKMKEAIKFKNKRMTILGESFKIMLINNAPEKIWKCTFHLIGSLYCNALVICFLCTPTPPTWHCAAICKQAMLIKGNSTTHQGRISLQTHHPLGLAERPCKRWDRPFLC